MCNFMIKMAFQHLIVVLNTKFCLTDFHFECMGNSAPIQVCNLIYKDQWKFQSSILFMKILFDILRIVFLKYKGGNPTQFLCIICA